MKNLRIVFALVLLASGFVYGNNTENNVVIKSDSNAVFNVHYKGTELGAVKIVIKNEENEVLFREVIRKKANFVRPYNLQELPVGNYSIAVTDVNGTKVQMVTIEKPKSIEVLANVTKLDNKRYLFTLGNVENKNVKIKIFAGEELVYEADEIVENSFGQIFNFENIYNSELRMEVMVEGAVVEQHIF